MTTCRSCGAPIRWDKSPKTGRPVPISLATGLNHFADCPNAREHRSRKPTPKPATEFADRAREGLPR